MTMIQPYMRRQARRLTIVLIADAATFTLFMLLVGAASLHVERNPLVAAVYGSGGVMGVVALKLAAAWLYEWRSRRTAATPVSRPYAAGFALLSSLAIAGTIVGSGFNVASLLSSTVLR